MTPGFTCALVLDIPADAPVFHIQGRTRWLDIRAVDKRQALGIAAFVRDHADEYSAGRMGGVDGIILRGKI